MEGIPVKISEKYKPPRKITLPSSIRNKINATLTFESYDFNLERSLVDRFSKLEDLKRKQLEKRAKKLEILKKFDLSRNKRNVEIDEPTPESTILTPVPIFTQKTETRKEPKQEGVFNLSDFENDTSSPFDNVELKTINDMEELAHVLGSSNISDNRSREVPNGYTNWQSNCNYNTYIPNTYNMSYPINMPSIPLMNSNVHNYTNPVNVSYNLPVEDNYQTGNMNDNMINKESEEEFGILKSFQKIIEDRRIEAEKQASIPTTSQYNPQFSTIDDPPDSLNEQERGFAKNMAEMGFPYPRVARAIQRFGLDEAKVVEFLLQVQSLLEDKQFREDQIEKALQLNDFKEDKTRQYLNDFIQIKNLGFKEDDIAAALAKTSDRDKALDILIS